MRGFDLVQVTPARAPIGRFVEAAARLDRGDMALRNDPGRLILAGQAMGGQTLDNRGVSAFGDVFPGLHRPAFLKESIKTSLNFISSHMQEDMAA